jgi:hypothetical protein
MMLERITFETSRAGEYFDSRQLSTLTGVAPQQFASVILQRFSKQLIHCFARPPTSHVRLPRRMQKQRNFSRDQFFCKLL